MKAPQTPWSPFTVGVWKYGKPQTEIVRYLVRSSRMNARSRDDPQLAALLAECRQLPAEQAVDVLLDLYAAAAGIAEKLGLAGEARFWQLMNFNNCAPHAMAVPEFAAAIMRRKLPLTIDNTLSMMASALKLEAYSDGAMQLIVPLVKLCEQYWSEWGSDARMRDSLSKLADMGRSIENAPQRKLVTRIERLLERPPMPSPKIAPVPLPDRQPSAAAQAIIPRLHEAARTYELEPTRGPLARFNEIANDAQALSRPNQAWLVRRAFEEAVELWSRLGGRPARTKEQYIVDITAWRFLNLADALLRRQLPLTFEELLELTDRSLQMTERHTIYLPHVPGLIRQIEKGHAKRAREPKAREILTRLADRIDEQGSERHFAKRLRKLMPDFLEMPITAGEAWSDAARDTLLELPEAQRRIWVELVHLCGKASSVSPSQKWLHEAIQLRDRIGRQRVTDCLLEWFPLVEKPRTQPLQHRWYNHEIDDHRILDHHASILKGLCWLAATEESDQMARTLGALAVSCYRKLPGVGARAVKVGNAAVYALGAMPGTAALGQLSRLRIKVKFGTAQAMIAKALDRAAEREGLPRAEIEELAVPAYGLEGVGYLREPLGECVAEIRVGQTLTASLHWYSDKGKLVKAVPAVVKRDHAEEAKDLKGAHKDIQAMLPAQRDRIDGLFMERKRWPLEVWRERYLDHPLVGAVARRLIWVFVDGKTSTAAAWLRDDAEGPPHADGRLVRADGTAFEPKAGSTVTLWHPIDESAKPGEDALRGDVAQWRAFYEGHRIRQPFKQAHREVYLLTDAERETRTYSNRFAAHIVRQHQFNALMRERSWKTQTRLMVDAEYGPAYRQLVAWNMRVEFWIEGVGEDDNDQFVLDSGAFRYLATDQVRFYRAAQRVQDNNPIALDQLPPIVLSECLRDADLFVGVASVGNNPEWADGGPEGRFRTYWQDFSFGTLGESAQTRRDILSRLIPRLAIADACTLSDRFLVVRGTKRTYKIHLGSGNILMEPNDQYLCIVQGRTENDRGVFLPFEGDRTLAIILSKAFMLAEDDKIKDRSILSQIGR